MNRFIAFSMVFASVIIGGSAFAASSDVETSIKDIMLYRNAGALVTRAGAVTLPTGSHTLVISGLPNSIDGEYGIRARLSGSTITSVNIDEQFVSGVTSPVQKAITEKMNKLIAANQKDQNAIEALNIQLRFIETLGEKAGTSVGTQGSNITTDFDVLEKTLEFVGGKSAKVLSDRAALEEQIRERDKQVKALLEELRQTGNTQKSTSVATLNVTTTNAGASTLELTYLIQNAGWNVEIEGALSSETNTTNISLFAVVSQQSGEAWENVPLTLSTATPSRRISGPQIYPTYLNLADPRVLRSESMVRASAPMQSTMDEVLVSGSRIKESVYYNTGLDAEFRISNSVNIAADGSEQRIILTTEANASNIVYRSVPRYDITAYAYADTALKDFPQLTNPRASLTRDGHFIGAGQWPDLMNDTPLQLPFGEFERINVEVVTIPSEDGDSGIFNKRKRDEEKKQFRVTNNHNKPVVIEIYDRIPQSMNEDLNVDILRGSTPPTETNIMDKPGTVMWRKTLTAGETWAINHWYRITYPADKQLINQR